LLLKKWNLAQLIEIAQRMILEKGETKFSLKDVTKLIEGDCRIGGKIEGPIPIKVMIQTDEILPCLSW
jgi:hypothetical protein